MKMKISKKDLANRKDLEMMKDGTYHHPKCNAHKTADAPKKYDGKIQDNYDNYLKESIRIGFDGFPVVEIIDEMEVTKECRRFTVRFKVKYVKLGLGEDKKPILFGVVTDRVDIANRLLAGGFGSHCYADEAATMELAVIDMCKKHNLIICRKAVSWPFAQAVVQDNFYKD